MISLTQSIPDATIKTAFKKNMQERQWRMRMQSWIYLGSEIYAADRAEEGFLKIEGFTFSSPEFELSGDLFGGTDLRFIGTEGMHTAPNGMMEGWLTYKDPKFPEMTLTVVLRMKKNQAEFRYVLTGEMKEPFLLGSDILLTKLKLPAEAVLFQVEKGERTPVSPMDHPQFSGSVAAETDTWSLFLEGADLCTIEKKDENLWASQSLHQIKETILGSEGFATDWLRFAFMYSPEKADSFRAEKS